MFIELLLALFLGIIAGTFTGLTPGIHVNLVSVFILGISATLLGIVNDLVISTFIIAMALTHTFVDAIPSIFLGAPDADTVLAVLPGHQMLLNGEGYNAVKLTIIGSLFGLLGSVLLMPLLIPFFPFIYQHIQTYVVWLLILVVIIMIISEGNKGWALIQFLLAGIFGLLVLNHPSLDQPLLSMLSGLFGISTLVVSLNDKVIVPKQKTNAPLALPPSAVAQATGASIVSGGTIALLPGLSSAQAAILANYFTRNLGDKGFLVLVGGINTVNMMVSVVTLYTIDKARNGAIVVIKELVQTISKMELFLFAAVGLIVAGLATLITLGLTRWFSRIISKVNYQYLCFGIIGIVTLVVTIFSGWWGIVILLIGTAIGILPSYTGVKKSLNMGCLLLPVILWLLF